MGGNFAEVENCFGYAKSGSQLLALGSLVHVGAEAPPYDVGFPVENTYSCDFFMGTSFQCAALTSTEELRNAETFAEYDTLFWNVKNGRPIALHKMFLPNS